MTTPVDTTATVELVTDVEKTFVDEIKEDTPEEELQDAIFVENTGDGTASLMKPRKPTLHHRGHDVDFNDMYNDGPNEGAADDDMSTYSVGEIQYVKWNIISSCLFTFSSLLYLAMAVMVIDYYYWYRDVPRTVYYADDDGTWWNYFVNCTEDGFFPEHVENADDDYTWMEWYNTSAFAEDDIVWLPRVANENAPGIEPYVSKYMMLYFWAALGFIFSGSIEIYLTRKAAWWVRAIYFTMIIAASFGFVSAILTNKDPFWSNICNCISVNLWALESIVIVMARLKGQEDFVETEHYDKTDLILGWNIKQWFWVADVSFMIGTWGDAITSYWYVFERDTFAVGVLAIVFAAFWLLCAFVYLGVAIYDFREYKYYQEMEKEYYQEIKGLEVEDGKVTGFLTEKDVSQDSDSTPSDDDKKAEVGVEQAPIPSFCVDQNSLFIASVDTSNGAEEDPVTIPVGIERIEQAPVPTVSMEESPIIIPPVEATVDAEQAPITTTDIVVEEGPISAVDTKEVPATSVEE